MIVFKLTVDSDDMRQHARPKLVTPKDPHLIEPFLTGNVGPLVWSGVVLCTFLGIYVKCVAPSVPSGDGGLWPHHVIWWRHHVIWWRHHVIWWRHHDVSTIYNLFQVTLSWLPTFLELPTPRGTLCSWAWVTCSTIWSHGAPPLTG